MKYKVGQIVLNNKLGLGKVLKINGRNITAYFKDQKDNPRIINIAVVPMEIPSDQSDPILAAVDANGKLRKRPKSTTPKPKKPKTPKIKTA